MRDVLRGPTGSAAGLDAIARSGGVELEFRSPGAGRLTLDWRVKIKRRSALIGSAAINIGSATTARFKLKLTSAGRRLLRTARRLRITESGAFATDHATQTTTVDQTITLRRRAS